MFDKLKEKLANYTEIEVAEAHCDGPCGVYDPSQARIEAESVKMLTKKILDLKRPEGDDAKAHAAYQNTLTRFITIKEERAEMAKHHILVLWTDYFKPEHLEKYPDLHENVMFCHFRAFFFDGDKARQSILIRRVRFRVVAFGTF